MNSIFDDAAPKDNSPLDPESRKLRIWDYVHFWMIMTGIGVIISILSGIMLWLEMDKNAAIVQALSKYNTLEQLQNGESAKKISMEITTLLQAEGLNAKSLYLNLDGQVHRAYSAQAENLITKLEQTRNDPKTAQELDNEIRQCEIGAKGQTPPDLDKKLAGEVARNDREHANELDRAHGKQPKGKTTAHNHARVRHRA